MKKIKRTEQFGYGSDKQDILDKVTDLCNQLLTVYKSNKSPEKIFSEMKGLVIENNFEFLGRGQNRIAFRYPNSEWVYKFPYREIGIQDNAAERFISSIVTNDPEVYKEIGNNLALVTDFSLGRGYENLCICMEFIPDLEVEESGIGTPEDKAIKAIASYSSEFVRTIEKVNQYFHLVDVHPTSAAMNWGVKNEEFCIRDYGYFIPRVGELESLTTTIDGEPVQYVYDPFTEIMLNSKLSVNEKIEKLAQTTEVWMPVDENGRRVGGEADVIEVVYAGRSLLTAFRRDYL